MACTLKEQMIILLLNGINYNTQAEYFKEIHRLSLRESQLDLHEMKKILNLNLRLDMKQMDEVKRLSHHSFIMGEDCYPLLWYEIIKPPLLMFYSGNLDLLNKPSISIIGSRKISPYGETMTCKLVEEIAKKGWISVSGLAQGIDTVVHNKACQMGKNTTIGIIANGFNKIYPKMNEELQKSLTKNQLILSEYLPDSPSLKHHFIMRNRLVAGISPIICVMEAARRSGSLITANYALQFNREIYALPGRISDPQSIGCNDLIKNGAHPINQIDSCVSEFEELFFAQKTI